MTKRKNEKMNIGPQKAIGFIFSTDQSAMSLLFTADFTIYLTVLHMIGRSKMNERLADMTPRGMMLDVCVSPMKKM
jgi:hypothetical protein